ncbi:Transposon Tf2-9 polyprotein [Dictyocoela roeselum]|nr:Transposon Tf2-9 polyprotein [Dictyocoela roeselum]
MSINEAIPTPKVIEIPMKIENKTYEALVDTGSVENYLPEKIAEDLKIDTDELPIAKLSEIADGSLMEIKKSTAIKFNLFNDTNNTYTSKFHILPNPKGQPILGMRFLLENNGIINLSENIIIIDDIEYEMNTRNKTSDNVQSEIISKTKIYEIRDEIIAIKDLIRKYKSKNPKIGNIRNAEHKIDLFEKFAFQKKEYSVPIGLQDDVSRHIDELIKDGIITETHSDIVSPAFVIKKKNGKIRLVIDYRHLNSITTKCHQLTPNMFELLSKLKGASLFSSIDLNQGYYQVSIAKEDIYKTGFRIMKRTFVFNKMPFGLCNAPATFQRTMNEMLKNINNTLIYLDDILIYSKNHSDHYKTLKSIFEIFERNNVSVNFEKSKFLQKEIDFLGHHITSQGVEPNISKINEYTFKIPKTKTQLQKILGLLNWYRPFVPLISVQLADIYALLKTKENKIKWTPEHTKTFNEIVNQIKAKQILYHPDLKKPFTLQTDASERGIGGMLLQDGKLIGLFSKKHNKQECNYSVVEKEVLAIVKSITHFKPIIYNAPIIIKTDNKNITFDGDLSKRINRWKLILEEYDYKIVHIDGKNNNEADLLSRSFKVNNFTKSRIYKLPTLEVNNTENNQNNNPNTTELNKKLKILHEKLLHPGITRFKMLLKRYTNLNISTKIIKQITYNCLVCNREKDETKKYGVVKYELNAENKNECVAIDIKGPIKMRHFKTSIKKKHFNILVMTDIYTRYTEVSILFETTADKVTDALTKSWIQEHNAPTNILTDNGRQFTSSEFKKFAKKNHINHILTAPNNPTGNSIVERANKEIGFVLRVSRGSTLQQLLNNIWTRLNLNINISTNYAPFELFFEKPVFSNYHGSLKIDIKDVRKRMKESSDKYNEKIAKTRKNIIYREGNLVFTRNFDQDKVKSKWNGPYKIVKISSSGSNVYVDKGNKIMRVSIKNVKPYTGEEDVVCNETAPTF